MGGRTLLVTRPGYVLSPDGDATHVLHRGEAELFGAFRAMAPAARFLASSERKRTLDALEDSFT